MAEFKRIIITNDGQSLMAKLMSGAGTVEFTKIGVSSTEYSDNQLEGLNSLTGIKQEAPISKVVRNNDSSVQVEGAINNLDLSTGYHMRTLGLYARDPQEGEILYAVANASVAGYMPPYNGRTPSGAYFKLVTTIGNADKVQLQVDPAAVATIGDVNDLQDQISDIQAYVGYTDDDIVGIEADLENRRVTRVAGAVNRTHGASFDNIRAFGGRKRATVADDGTVLGYYGESGYDETGETGQVMVEQPKFYYKVVPLKMDKIEDGKGFHLRKARYYVSDYPKEGFKVHPAFIDENGNVREYIYLSAFEGSIYDESNQSYLMNDEQLADFEMDKLSSIPGAKPASGLTQNLTRGNTRKLAKNRGVGWEQSYSATASLTQLLFIIEYASFNTQEALAYGVYEPDDGESNMSQITGATTSLGNKSGEVINENDQSIPSYRGEENWYGNIWRWVDGLNIEAKGLHNLHVATHSFEDNTGEKPYEDAGFTLAKSNGYVSAFGYSEKFDWLFFPSETNGNTSVPVGDYLYQNNEYNGWLVAVLGGNWYSGLDGGGFHWSVNNASGSRYRARGGRLVYAPPVE